MEREVTKPRIHSATTYKLYILSCILMSSGIVIMFKFPEMHALEPGVDPLSFSVYGLSLKVWKIIHLLGSLAFLVLTGLHIWFNRDWIRRVGSKKLNLGVVTGLAIGFAIILAGILAPHA